MKSKTTATVPSPEIVTVKPVNYIALLVKSIIVLFSLLVLLGFVGSVEYNEDLYYSIPDAAFEEISLKLGDGATEFEILEEFQANKAYYLSLN